MSLLSLSVFCQTVEVQDLLRNRRASQEERLASRCIRFSLKSVSLFHSVGLHLSMLLMEARGASDDSSPRCAEGWEQKVTAAPVFPTTTPIAPLEATGCYPKLHLLPPSETLQAILRSYSAFHFRA